MTRSVPNLIFWGAPGIDHLLDGPHLLERSDTTEDWRVACLMGLLTVLSSAHEVLRISPLPRARIHNAVCNGVVHFRETLTIGTNSGHRCRSAADWVCHRSVNTVSLEEMYFFRDGEL